MRGAKPAYAKSRHAPSMRPAQDRRPSTALSEDSSEAIDDSSETASHHGSACASHASACARCDCEPPWDMRPKAIVYHGRTIAARPRPRLSIHCGSSKLSDCPCSAYPGSGELTAFDLFCQCAPLRSSIKKAALSLLHLTFFRPLRLARSHACYPPPLPPPPPPF
jgi:hypothetical protein